MLLDDNMILKFLEEKIDTISRNSATIFTIGIILIIIVVFLFFLIGVSEDKCVFYGIFLCVAVIAIYNSINLYGRVAFKEDILDNWFITEDVIISKYSSSNNKVYYIDTNKRKELIVSESLYNKVNEGDDVYLLMVSDIPDDNTYSVSEIYKISEYRYIGDNKKD